MAQSPSLQYAADAAEKAGDTKTQDTVKKMQYPYIRGEDGKTDPSKLPSADRQQRYRTQDNEKKIYDKKAAPSTFKKGGLVKRSGMAKVHKGERVLTKSQTKRYGKGKA